MTRENDWRMWSMMALLTMVAIGSGWALYAQEPTFTQASQFFLTYIYIPGMVVTFLVCRLPQIFRAILIALVVLPALFSTGVILSGNETYKNFAWGYLVFLGVILLSSFSIWNNQQKVGNPEYGFRTVVFFLLVVFSFFIGTTAGTAWGIAFFIGVPLSLFLSARGLKRLGQKK